MRIQGRYEIRGIIGEGGMGIVYRAEDLKLRTEVAVKTIRDPHDAACFDLFKKECAVLTSLNHANIVDIRDIGEYEEQGVIRPYLVMPLLPGVTLDKIIEGQPGRLTPARVVDMMVQVCRGLQAAHDARLVHRDLKPSNIFVFADDSVKIIDFGIAHLLDQRSTVGGKGTPHYMSPEQVTGGRLTAESDIFSLGVICFESLTRRRPFAAATRDEVFQNIVRTITPPISDLNPAVPPLLSQVIHLALAKQPVFRYRSARELAECLQKGLRGEPIERFEPASIAPRLGRIRQALESSDYEDANDLLSAIEAEGYLHPEIPSLRKQATLALRSRRVGQLLDSAKRLFHKGEYPLVLERLQRVLDEDPSNPEALQLISQTEGKRQADQYNKWMRLAEEHLQNFSFAQSRDAARHAQEYETTDGVLQLLSEIDARERDYQRIRKEKEELYQSALENQRIGNLTQAAEKLERLVILNNRAPEKTSPDRGAAYEKLFNEVRSERDQIESARAEAYKLMQNKEYEAAIAVCDRILEKYPKHALLRNFRLEIGERQQQELSEYIAKVDREAQAEPDLNRRAALYEEALQRFPGEGHFSRTLRIVSERRDAIDAHVADARNKEERGQYAEALSQWETLRTLYPQYPGLDLEIERVERRREEQKREEDRAAVVLEIRRRLATEELDEAARLAAEAQTERPDDPEIRTLNELSRDRLVKANETLAHLEAGKAAQSQGDLETAICEFRLAYASGEKQMISRARLVDALVARSREVLDQQPAEAIRLAREALSIDEANPRARAQYALVLDRGRDEVTDEFLQRAGAARERGDLEGALREVNAGLSDFPEHDKLTRFRQTLREADLERVKALRQSMRQAQEPEALRAISEQIQQVAARHQTDPRFETLAKQAETDRQTLGRELSATRVMKAAAGASSPAPAPVAMPLAAHPPAESEPTPMPPSAVVVPPPAARRLSPKALAGGIGALGLLLLVPAFLYLRSSQPVAPVVAAKPALPEAVAPAVAVSRQPGLLLNLAPGGKFELKDSTGKILTIDQRDTTVDFPAGTYELTVKDRTGESFTATATMDDTGRLQLANVKSSPRLLLTIFELRGGKARVFGAKVAGPTKDTAENVPETGLELPIPANSRLAVGATRQWAYDVTVRPEDRPVVQVHVWESGLAEVAVCQVPMGATVEIASAGIAPRKLLASKTMCAVGTFKPGKYQVLVSAEGWAPRHDEINVVLDKPNKFDLAPQQQLPGRILITNAEPGAEVWLNDARSGVTAGADGTASLESAAGAKTIQLRKRNFTSGAPAALTVEPGKNVTWSAAGHLKTRTFPVSIVVTPASATVTIRGNGREFRWDGKPLELPAGNYDFVAQAEGYENGGVSRAVVEGEPLEAKIVLRSKAAPAPAVVTKRVGLECLKAKQGCGPFPGSFQATVKSPGRIKKVDWSIGGLEFKLDRDTFRVGSIQSKHGLTFGETLSIACVVEEARVRCKLDGNDQPVVPGNMARATLRIKEDVSAFSATVQP